MSNRLSDRTFGLALAALFAIIGAIGWFASGKLLIWALAISALSLSLALVAPGVLLPLNRLWSGFAHRITQFTNLVLLSVLFSVLIVPFGFVFRLFGWDPMRRARHSEAISYLTPVQRRATVDVSQDMF